MMFAYSNSRETMSTIRTSITQDEFNMFHSIDRSLYSILVINLHRDPAESMQVLALFMWLERKGFGRLVEKIVSFPHLLINELAQEAVTCLNYINNHLNGRSPAPASSSHAGESLPLMKSTLTQEISLRFFHENRQSGVQGIARIIDTVCIRALADIASQTVQRNPPRDLPDERARNPPAPPVPQAFPGWQWSVVETVPPDDRTLFITFSKGYPVQEWEVRDFFTRIYGNCVESIYMQEVQPNEQSLFARIVFRTVSTIALILDDNGKAKFTINGKHAWARKYVPKRSKVVHSS